MKIQFNDKAIKKMTKKDFLKQFNKYTRFVDLESYWQSLQPKNAKNDSK